MTDRDKAVELLARGLAEQYFEGRRDLNNPLDVYDWASRDELHKAGWKLVATALLDQLAPLLTVQAVAVKPLVWNVNGSFAAHTPFGLYEIEIHGPRVHMLFAGGFASRYDDLEAAKAAAQADYEARILSAIEAVPLAQAVEAERAACTEELRLAVTAARVGALREALSDVYEWMKECIAQSPNPDITHEAFRIATWRNAVICRDKIAAALTPPKEPS